MHVSSSQWNTATQTDDKTHTERTAAAARILVVRAGLQHDMLWPSNATALRIEVVGLSVHLTPLDNKSPDHLDKSVRVGSGYGSEVQIRFHLWPK